jgi:hypothetical protein
MICADSDPLLKDELKLEVGKRNQEAEALKR